MNEPIPSLDWFEMIEIGQHYRRRLYDNKYKPFDIVRVIDKDYVDIDGIKSPLVIFEYLDENMGEMLIGSNSPSILEYVFRGIAKVEIGKIYIYKDSDNLFKRVIVTDTFQGEETGSVMIAFNIINSTSNDQNFAMYQDEFKRRCREIGREPHCWKCKKDLNENNMDVCEKCGWIICPDDGACSFGKYHGH